MTRTPIAAGVALAVLAAVAFGVTTPIVAWARASVGAFSTAALLYGGAAAVALLLELVTRRTAPSVRRADAPRLIAIALVGAAIAPSLFAWGLEHTGATTGALLLNLEAVFTMLLARTLYREPIGQRVAIAVACMVLGGGVLAIESSSGGGATLLGVVAVAGATLAWASDNTLTRPLAERDPFQVIAVKAMLGAGATLALAVVRGEAMPPLAPTAALLACGATGYGASLYLYMLAQRRIGAGRTGSVFALAPFIGAALGWLLGDRHAGPLAGLATALFGVGVYLHATERHAHRHAHPAIEHDHVHRHDDGHHTHVHDPPVVGEHSHAHAHEPVEHEHEHAPDVHHDHDHVT